jgi:hypothetical protein
MAKRVVVFHAGYGCDTGCCGHVVQLDDGPEHFTFAHPGNEDPRTFAEDLVREELGEEHVADLDWEESQIYDD